MIESAQNRQVKDIRRLRRKQGDHLLIEGPHLLGEALDAGLTIETVLGTPRFLAEADRALLSHLGRPPIEIAPRVLGGLTDSDSPRGVLAVAQLPRAGAEALPIEPQGIYLLLAGLQDPGNLGAIARATEAAGASGIALTPGSVHPNHPRALRGSAGSLFRLPVAVEVEPGDLERHLEPIEATWVAMSSNTGADIFKSAPTPPLVLVIGAERGLESELAERCDAEAHIPMAAPVDSLNTAVAVAVTLFELRRQRTAIDE